LALAWPLAPSYFLKRVRRSWCCSRVGAAASRSVLTGKLLHAKKQKFQRFVRYAAANSQNTALDATLLRLSRTTLEKCAGKRANFFAAKNLPFYTAKHESLQTPTIEFTLFLVKKW
jgi:hypothetical protein